MNSDLQGQLLSREKEVEKLRQALEAAAERSLSTGSFDEPSPRRAWCGGWGCGMVWSVYCAGTWCAAPGCR